MSDYEQWGKGIQAKVIEDSENVCGNRMTTFVLKYPRMVHAELMTHRMFSRNSSSSRAIPAKKLIQRVIDDPAMPVWWGKNQSGMQAREELGPDEIKACKLEWLVARDEAVASARSMMKMNLHKQIVNRIIEPWMHITVICTSTNFLNWFALRDHPDAQPEIAALARQMRIAYDASQPKLLSPGGWHLPFINEGERERHTHETLTKVSTARCARVSYLTHEGERSVSKDVALHDRLYASRPPHASAFEHCALALASPQKIGNVTGFLQYRMLVTGEAVHEGFEAKEVVDGS